MGKTMRTTAAIALAGFENVVMLAAAGTGGVLGYNAPALLTDAGVDGWPGSTTSTWAAFSAGLIAIAFAFGVSELLDSFMSPLRALTRTSTSPAYGLGTQETDEDLPTDAEDLIDRLTEAARAGGAHDAAMYSGRVDPAGNLLHKAKLWVGIDGTSALFPLTDGAYVHYRKNEDGKFATHEYAFVVTGAEDEPVPVTSMDQVRDLLERHLNHEVKDEPVSA
ncbi:hypothetical protein E4N62_24865 [Streptomyces sp. MNU76]|uniref:hypothetical protein n=1 Tax=Streptomyces sp. MNU76 TaxID=2560026 RepID=UPI001E4CE449|nr:hypothetical protein [Streptomyces sp. MNU76]MCC9708204.1 hypothetical protein [Streptomyces sp. MNU76]